MAYDITAMCHSSAVQPNGKVKVTFNIPENFDMSRVALVYIDDNGGLEEIASKIDSAAKTITAELEHFSTYAVIETAEKKTDTTNIKTETNDTVKTDDNTSPKTGDSAAPYVAVPMLFALVCVALSVSKAKKNEI